MVAAEMGADVRADSAQFFPSQFGRQLLDEVVA